MPQNEVKIILITDASGTVIGFKTASGAAVKFGQEATDAANQASSGFKDLERCIQTTIAPLYILTKGLGTLKDNAMASLEYLGKIETASLGIASSYMVGGKYIDQMSGKALTGQQALAAAQQDSKDIMEELQVANFQTIATLDQLIRAYQETLPVAQAKGFNRQQIKEYTVAMVQAAGAIGLSLDQMAEETRSLLTGTINPRTSRIGVILGLTNEDIRQHSQSAQQLFDFLMSKLEAYKIAGLESQKTWAGIMSNTKDIAKQVGGMAFQPLFESVKYELLQMADRILKIDEKTKRIKWDPQFLEGINSFKSGLTDVIAELYRMGMFIDKIAGSSTRLGSLVPGQIGEYYRGLNKYWEDRYKASDKALQDMAMRREGYRPITPADMEAVHKSGKRFDTRTIEGHGVYVKDPRINAQYEGDPSKPDDDDKKAKEHYNAIAAAKKESFDAHLAIEKSYWTTSLAIEKSNEALALAQLDNRHKMGLLGDEAYYDRRLSLLNEYAKSEVESLRNAARTEKDKLWAQKKQLTDDYEKALPEVNKEISKLPKGQQAKAREAFDTKHVAEQAKLYQKIVEIDNTAQQKITEVENKHEQSRLDNAEQKANRRISLTIETLQFQLELTKMSGEQELQAQLNRSKQEEETIKHLYGIGLLTAEQYSTRLIELSNAETETKKRALDIQLRDLIIEKNKELAVVGISEDQKRKISEDLERARLKYAGDSQQLAMESADKIRSLTWEMNELTGSFSEGASRGFSKYSQDAGNAFKRGEAFAQSSIKAMEKGMEDFFDSSSQGFLNWGNLAINVIHEVSMAMFRAQLIQPAAASASGFLGMGMGNIAGRLAPDSSVYNAAAGNAPSDILAGSQSFADRVTQAYYGGGFAMGGVIKGGFVPFRAFANGGIADRPTFGLIGEGDYNEAVIPLPDGKRVPVSLSGNTGGSNTILLMPITINAVDAKSFYDMCKRSPGAIMEPVLNGLKGNGVLRQAIRSS
ncbi:MAG: phage tail tape measure protein [Nitrospirae bacterium]|nr:MAG: phage tail tape measure protein [Nitrospirota bacterium]